MSELGFTDQGLISLPDTRGSFIKTIQDSTRFLFIRQERLEARYPESQLATVETGILDRPLRKSLPGWISSWFPEPENPVKPPKVTYPISDDDDYGHVKMHRVHRKTITGEVPGLKEIVSGINVLLEHPLLSRSGWIKFSGFMIGGLFVLGYIFGDSLDNRFDNNKRYKNGIKWSSFMLLGSAVTYVAFLW